MVTYVNEHCAACNYDNASVLAWVVQCVHNQYLYDAVTDDEYIDRSLHLPDTCGVQPIIRHVNITDGDSYHGCYPEYHDVSNLVTRCNVTGHWLPSQATHAEHVRRACEEASPDESPGTRVIFGHDYPSPPQAFVNVFCALCNGLDVWSTSTVLHARKLSLPYIIFQRAWNC
jgi:hypothetical protein